MIILTIIILISLIQLVLPQLLFVTKFVEKNRLNIILINHFVFMYRNLQYKLTQELICIPEYYNDICMDNQKFIIYQNANRVHYYLQSLHTFSFSSHYQTFSRCFLVIIILASFIILHNLGKVSWKYGVCSFYLYSEQFAFV